MRRHPTYHYGPDSAHHPVRHIANAMDIAAGDRGETTRNSLFRHKMSPRNFLTLGVCGAIVLFGLVWLWVFAVPMAFLDPEYPSWRAKQILLSDCDLGDIVILGDSAPPLRG